MDPYTAGMFPSNPYRSKRPVRGRLVVVLDGRLSGRGLELIRPISRALRRGEIHELVVTAEADAGPGTTVNQVTYLGFFEVEEGGMAVTGDSVRVDGRPVGRLGGFDETHHPNHLNLVLVGDDATGFERGLALGDEISIGETDEGGQR